MSDLAALATGIGIGLLIVLPVVIVLRREIAQNLHNLLGSSTGKGGAQNQAFNKQGGNGGTAATNNGHSGGISAATAMFGVGATTVTALYGVLFGGVIFIISGIFVMLCVLAAFVIGRASRK